MTDKAYPYDPEFPIVAVNALGFGFARFTCMNHARHYAPECTPIDTTPKSRVPDDAMWIAWDDGISGSFVASRRGSIRREWVWGSGYYALEDLPGVTPDTVFTVLDAREERKG